MNTIIKKMLIGFVLGLGTFLVVKAAFAADRGDDHTLMQITKCTTLAATQVAVTDTNSQVTAPRDTKSIYIENIGANELYWDPSDGVAVANTSHSKLEPGDNRSLSYFATTSIGIIADTAETTTALVEVCY